METHLGYSGQPAAAWADDVFRLGQARAAGYREVGRLGAVAHMPSSRGARRKAHRETRQVTPYFLKSLDSAIAHSPPDRPVQRHLLTTFARAEVDEAPWRQKCPPWAIARNHASTRAIPGMFDLQWLLPYTWPAWVLPSGTDAIENISARRSSAYTTASWRLGVP